MLISPPFLLANNNQLDPAWVSTCMPLDGEHGHYPVAYALQWHGGIHLKAPQDNTALAPLRAIADGKVVFVRQPTEFSDSPTHPLQYGNNVADHEKASGPNSVWTDDGCVVMEHTTEIGAEGDTPVSVTFYSIYMHLSAIEPTVQKDRMLYRKDPIGQAGRVYGGMPDRCHFEIVCDDANLKKLVGRDTDDLDLTKHGRSDVVYGELYFLLPANTPVYGQAPLDNTPTAMMQPATPAGQTTTPPPPQPLTATATLTDALIVGLRYDEGYALNSRGGLAISSYQLDGTRIVNQPLLLSEAEYNLYDRATEISLSYPANSRPAPSAVYELLRFGRVLNTANETLTPANVPHWREISLPTGSTGWVNLNASNVKIFSDADFPHFKGWKLVSDGGQGADSRCDSQVIRDLLDVDSNGAVTPTEAATAYAAKREQMNTIIAKFPSEWDQTNLEAKWAWLKTSSAENAEALEEADFNLFKTHLQKLSFWSEVSTLPKDPWHFNPIAFIQHFRQCGWLSDAEFASTFPKYPFYTSSGNPRTTIKNPASVYMTTAEQARTKMSAHTKSMNRVIRKYIGAGKQRISIFLSQVMLETAQWRDLGGSKLLMHEWGFGAYSAANPMTQHYTAFYGRGIMQLTWSGNYKDYGNYRQLTNHIGSYTERLIPASPRISATSTHYDKSPNDGGSQFQWSPRYDPDFIATDSYAACDSGGFYWASKAFSEGKDINRVSDRTYSTDNTGFVNRLVNGGGNGYYERQAYTAFMLRQLGDSTDSQETMVLNLPSPKNNIRVDFLRATK